MTLFIPPSRPIRFGLNLEGRVGYFTQADSSSYKTAMYSILQHIFPLT